MQPRLLYLLIALFERRINAFLLFLVGVSIEALIEGLTLNGFECHNSNPQRLSDIFSQKLDLYIESNRFSHTSSSDLVNSHSGSITRRLD
jgi:hypothetical protein